jgi:hypothetical protein
MVEANPRFKYLPRRPHKRVPALKLIIERCFELPLLELSRLHTGFSIGGLLPNVSF